MGDGNKVEFFVAMCALITSVVAVYIGWDQGRVMRAQQHGEVFPVLQIDGFVSNTSEHTAIGLRVENSGVGPALIKSVVMEVEGAPIPNFGAQLTGLPSTSDVSWRGLSGRAIAPGNTVTPIEIRWAPGTISREDLISTAMRSENWALRICYCSVFDRCWRTRGIGTASAERVEFCPKESTDIFTNLGLQPDPRISDAELATETLLDTND